MGWAKRVKEKTMGKPFLVARRELAVRLARMVQFLGGAAAVTVAVTWVDETADRADAITHVSTAYGETSTGRPIGSLGGELPLEIATQHLKETVTLVEEQKDSIAKAAAAAAVTRAAEAEALVGQPHEPNVHGQGPPEGLEGEVSELAKPEEEANASAHE